MKIIIVPYDYEKLEQVNMVTIESETTKRKFEYKFHQAFEIKIHAHDDVSFFLFSFSFFLIVTFVKLGASQLSWIKI
jgi:hypothetical protein